MSRTPSCRYHRRVGEEQRCFSSLSGFEASFARVGQHLDPADDPRFEGRDGFCSISDGTTRPTIVYGLIADRERAEQRFGSSGPRSADMRGGSSRLADSERQDGRDPSPAVRHRQRLHPRTGVPA